MAEYKVASLDDLEYWEYKETLTGRVRHELGISAFGVNSWKGEQVGDRVIPEHAEDQEGDQDELYVVVRGRARFEVGGETVDAPQGALVYVPAGPTVRTAFAEEPGTLVLAVGATAGKAFETIGWEPWGKLHDLYAAGDYEGVIAKGRAEIEANPQYPHAALQPRLRREPCRPQGGRRPPPGDGDRRRGAVPRHGQAGLRLRQRPRRAGVSRAGRLMYRVAQIDEIDAVDDGRVAMRPVRHHLGITAFGVNSFSAAKSGDRVINEHAEDQPNDPEELYVVVAGHARFEVGDDTIDAPQGTLVFVPPGPRRTAFAEADGTTVFVIGATAGQAYEPSGWEIFTALSLYSSGDYEGYIARAEPRSRRTRRSARRSTTSPASSLAAARRMRSSTCGRQSSAGRRSNELAPDDPDFDAIRDEPGLRGAT